MVDKMPGLLAPSLNLGHHLKSQLLSDVMANFAAEAEWIEYDVS